MLTFLYSVGEVRGVAGFMPNVIWNSQCGPLELLGGGTVDQRKLEDYASDFHGI